MSPSPTPQARRLVFPAKQQVHLENLELPELREGTLLFRTELSLMSTGTENIVFNRLFDPGTGWDAWVQYPFHPGYCAVGVVEAVNGASQFKPGDRVAARINHQSHAVVTENECWLIPDGLAPEAAVWFALAKIAFHGALAASYQLGDSVLIIGAGPIGQMSVRWARAAGATSIIVVDTAAERMTLASAGGATNTIVAPIDQVKDAIQAVNGGLLPNIVIDSTGNAQVFASALGLVRQYGKVVILGDTGSPASQKLTHDVISRGLTIIGAHDTHQTPQWNQRTITSLFLTLAASGRFPLEGLNSHSFSPADCALAYETANRERSKTMGIVFNWNQSL